MISVFRKLRATPRGIRLISIILLSLILFLQLVYGYVFIRTEKPGQGIIYVPYPSPNRLGISTKTEKAHSPIKIKYSKYGIPSIFVDKQDEALFALGFVHAKERIWQMELQRLSAQGSLGLLFGKRFLNSDLFLRAIGFYRKAKEFEKNLDNPTKNLLQKYCDGINAFLEKYKYSQAPEFILRNHYVKKWTITDIIASFKFFHWQLANDLRERVFIRNLMLVQEKIKQKSELLNLLIRSFRYRIDDEENPYISILGTASISGKTHKESLDFKVSLLSDLKRIPGNWFFSSLHILSDNENKQIIQGLSVPGLPFFLIGENRRKRWFWLPWKMQNINTEKLKNRVTGMPLELLPREVKDNHFFDPESKKWIKFKEIQETLNYQEDDKIYFQRSSFFDSELGPWITPLFNNLGERLRIGHDFILNWQGLKDIQDFKILFRQSFIKNEDDILDNGQSPYLFVVVDQDDIRPMCGDLPHFSKEKKVKKFTEQAKQICAFRQTRAEKEQNLLQLFSEILEKTAIFPEYFPPVMQKQDREKYDPSNYQKRDKEFAKNVYQLIQESKLALIDLEKKKRDALEQYARKESPSFNSQLKLLKNWDGQRDENSSAAAFVKKIKIQLIRNILYDKIGEVFTDEFFHMPYAAENFAEDILQYGLQNPQLTIFDILRTKNFKENFYDIVRLSFYDAIFFLQKEISPHISKWELGKINYLKPRHPLEGEGIGRYLFSVKKERACGCRIPENLSQTLPFFQNEVRYGAGLKIRLLKEKFYWQISSYSSQSGHPLDINYYSMGPKWTQNEYVTWKPSDPRNYNLVNELILKIY